jgi:hypothetical protein
MQSEFNARAHRGKPQSKAFFDRMNRMDKIQKDNLCKILS